MSTETIEIPRNTYRVECDRATKAAIKWAVEMFAKGNDEVTFVREDSESRKGPKSFGQFGTSEAVAMEVARNFVDAGYHAALDRFVTGYFASLTISRKPISCGYSAEIIG